VPPFDCQSYAAAAGRQETCIENEMRQDLMSDVDTLRQVMTARTAETCLQLRRLPDLVAHRSASSAQLRHVAKDRGLTNRQFTRRHGHAQERISWLYLPDLIVRRYEGPIDSMNIREPFVISNDIDSAAIENNPPTKCGVRRGLRCPTIGKSAREFAI
jgi:hypothetical protein